MRTFKKHLQLNASWTLFCKRNLCTHLFKNLDKIQSVTPPSLQELYILEEEQNIAYPCAEWISLSFDTQSLQISKFSGHVPEDKEPHLPHHWGQNAHEMLFIQVVGPSLESV